MSTRCEIGYTFVYKVGQCLGVCLVGVAEKITGNGNVDTINSTRHVGTVSLMLFSRCSVGQRWYSFVPPFLRPITIKNIRPITKKWKL